MLLTGVIALVVGIGTFGSTAEEARGQAGTGTMVTATYLESVPQLALEQPPSDVPATWTGPDGQPRTGVVAAVGVRAGDQVQIWVDPYGARVSPPPTQVDAVGAGVTSGLAVLLAGGIVLAAVWLLVRRATDAANVRRWEREWAMVGPRWSGGQ
jgi:hypothetical protein